MSTKVQLISYRPPKAGSDAKYVARVAFVYECDMAPVLVKRSYNAGTDEKPEWRNIEVAAVHDARKVEVKEAFIRESQKGNYYVDVRGVDVPYEVGQTVLQLAADENVKRKDDAA